MTTIYAVCDFCGDDVPVRDLAWHECESDTPGYDPLEPWMDNE
jgi:hypothetical protein